MIDRALLGVDEGRDLAVLVAVDDRHVAEAGHAGGLRQVDQGGVGPVVHLFVGGVAMRLTDPDRAEADLGAFEQPIEGLGAGRLAHEHLVTRGRGLAQSLAVPDQSPHAPPVRGQCLHHVPAEITGRPGDHRSSSLRHALVSLRHPRGRAGAS